MEKGLEEISKLIKKEAVAVRLRVSWETVPLEVRQRLDSLERALESLSGYAIPAAGREKRLLEML